MSLHFFFAHTIIVSIKKTTLNTVIPTAARNRNCRGVSAKILSHYRVPCVPVMVLGVCVAVPSWVGRGRGTWAYLRGARANFSRDSTVEHVRPGRYVRIDCHIFHIIIIHNYTYVRFIRFVHAFAERYEK